MHFPQPSYENQFGLIFAHPINKMRRASLTIGAAANIYYFNGAYTPGRDL